MAAKKSKPIFHITHMDNLSAIIEAGSLWSDRRVLQEAPGRTVIGFETIKQRRLDELPVHCHPGTMVGDYVPFYFCPRSPMLYVIHRKNTELAYQGGQEKVVHLVSTIDAAVQAANDRPWAFSDGNAGARYTQFSADLDELDSFIDWNAVKAKYWIDPAVKNKKQAEFLVHDSFPWTAFLRVGVMTNRVAHEVQSILEDAAHQPEVVVKPSWYY